MVRKHTIDSLIEDGWRIVANANHYELSRNGVYRCVRNIEDVFDDLLVPRTFQANRSKYNGHFDGVTFVKLAIPRTPLAVEKAVEAIEKIEADYEQELEAA